MTNNETLAYLTGIVDGEGYIGIKRDSIKGRGINPVYYERMSVASNNRQVIDLFVTVFNCGKVYPHKPSKLSKRGYWSWEVSNLLCIGVIKKIYPYLLIKKPEADLVISLYKNKRKKYSPLPKGIVEYREGLYLGIRKLHQFP